MKILIATPAYGGKITTGYFTSILRILTHPQIRNHHQVEVFTIGNDALIPRARQECAKTALDVNADKLIFIDADIIFNPDDLLKLIKSEHPVVGGTYRKKCPEPIFNFNVPLETEEKVRKNTNNKASNSIEGFKELRKLAGKDNVVVATHLATGFLAIHTDVIRELSKVVPNYVTDRRSNHKMHYSSEEVKHLLVPEIFPVRVCNNILESEDWGFCRLCNENNIPVHLDTSIVVDHMAELSLGHSIPSLS